MASFLPTTADTDIARISDATAEAACIRGDDDAAALLSRYLREGATPSHAVIQNIARCLLANQRRPGPGNWELKFAVRNGRPPQCHTAINSAAGAIAHGQRILLGQYLRVATQLDDETRHALASALDPSEEAPSKWRLKYVRPRRGFPRSKLRNQLILAMIGHEALMLHRGGKPWHKIYADLPHAETLIKKAVRFVNGGKPRKPPE